MKQLKLDIDLPIFYDKDGIEIKDGDTLWSSYGIPPKQIEAKVTINSEGILMCLTPGHNPSVLPLSEFMTIMNKDVEVVG